MTFIYTLFNYESFIKFFWQIQQIKFIRVLENELCLYLSLVRRLEYNFKVGYC